MVTSSRSFRAYVRVHGLAKKSKGESVPHRRGNGGAEMMMSSHTTDKHVHVHACHTCHTYSTRRARSALVSNGMCKSCNLCMAPLRARRRLAGRMASSQLSSVHFVATGRAWLT